MLGKFLELSVTAESLSDSFEYYRSLGFSNVATGDLLPHNYVVLQDGDFCIGLHQRPVPEPRLTFARPDLGDYSRALKRQRVVFEYSRLTDDEFNELGFLDPAGQTVALVEAQTFSPSPQSTGSSSFCGEFMEYSVWTPSCHKVSEYWQRLGMQVAANGMEPYPWVKMNGYGLTIGFHETSQFPAGPSYHAVQLQARLEYLELKNVVVQRGMTAIQATATLLAPEGTPLYLFSDSPVTAG